MEDTQMLDVIDEPTNLMAFDEMEVDHQVPVPPAYHDRMAGETSPTYLVRISRYSKSNPPMAYPLTTLKAPKKSPPKVRFRPYPGARRWLHARGKLAPPRKEHVPLKVKPVLKSVCEVMGLRRPLSLKTTTHAPDHLAPVTNPRKRQLDDDGSQPDTKRRDPDDTRRVNIDGPVSKEDTPVPHFPGSWPQDPPTNEPSTPPSNFVPLMSGALQNNPHDRTPGGIVPISPNGTHIPPEYLEAEFDHDNQSGISSWRGLWLPCHKVADICMRVQRGLRQTILSTVQVAVEVLGSVKRRAFGIERRQESRAIHIPLSSRKRLEARRREMLVGKTLEQRRALRDQWKRQDRNLPPSPTRPQQERLIAKSGNEPFTVGPLPSLDREQFSTPSLALSEVPRRKAAAHKTTKSSLKKGPPRRNATPIVTRNGSPLPKDVLNRTKTSRITKSKSWNSVSKHKYVKGEWVRTNNGFVPPWLRNIPQHRVSLDSLDPSFLELHNIPLTSPPPMTTEYASPSFPTEYVEPSASRPSVATSTIESAAELARPSAPRAVDTTTAGSTTEAARPPTPRRTATIESTAELCLPSSPRCAANTATAGSTTETVRPSTPHRTVDPTTTSEATVEPVQPTSSRCTVDTEFSVEDEPVLRPELAPYLRRVPQPAHVDDTRADDAVENELGQALQQLSVARVEDEPAGHSPLAVHWLQSDTPLGRPISSVRLFNPESPVRPPRRNEALYEHEWRQKDQLNRRGRRLRPEPGRAVRPLSPQWEARVADAMSAPNSRQLATTLNGDPLTRRDLASCHTPEAWLNDEVINAYLLLLVDYLRRVSGNAGRLDRPKYHAFNSFFYSNLRDRGYESVRRWATRAKIGGEALLDVDMVFVPVHNSAHWTLLVVRPATRSIEYYDSLGSRSLAHVNNIKKWLRGELGDHYVEEEWAVLPSNSPQQDNGSDCGVFLLTTAKALAVGLEPDVYSSADITTLRKKIVAELINGGLEGEFDPVGESGESRL
ncbi:hypothetical protein VTN96DRAFT_5107 [Rasamsonia emersonii]|uniref:Protease n=1 Tax=Rasamsonia emersonii (strain ATCC 16479 / CBS 393.64 / IMI 116815) TaxID=1408163 RepID=A0A0F4Z5U2_RASE3|nr:Protease [Rasamsonia emersonii CBS 393.64]KKA25685.1 Protease [Rasamsonia emersonii CBS 393.64]